MKKQWWIYAFLLFLLALSISGIFDHTFIDYTELRESDPGREFLMPHHDWLVPTLNNQPYIEKPPLVHWAVALSLMIFGVVDWAARVPCIFFGWGILLFTFLLARRLYNKEVGIGAVLVLATTACFLARTHQLTSDVGLFFFVSGGAYFLYRAFTGSAWWYSLFYLFAVGAFFSKGLIGLIFLGGLFLAWVIWMRDPGAILKAKPWFGLPVILLPIAAWMAQLPGHSLYFYLVENQVERFFPTESYKLGNENPFYYYLFTFPQMFAPWIIIWLAAIPWFWSQRREAAMKFLLCWFLPGFILLNLAGTKRGLYLAPLLPPLAIMVAAWFVAKNRMRWLVVSAVVIGVGVLAYAYAVLPKLEAKESWRPIFEKLDTMIIPETKIYGYNSNEALKAAIPFYLGRYFTEVKDEPELAGFSRQSNFPAVVVAYADSKDMTDAQMISKYFPYLWLQQKVINGRRTIRVFANRPAN